MGNKSSSVYASSMDEANETLKSHKVAVRLVLGRCQSVMVTSGSDTVSVLRLDAKNSHGIKLLDSRSMHMRGMITYGNNPEVEFSGRLACCGSWWSGKVKDESRRTIRAEVRFGPSSLTITLLPKHRGFSVFTSKFAHSISAPVAAELDLDTTTTFSETLPPAVTATIPSIAQLQHQLQSLPQQPQLQQLQLQPQPLTQQSLAQQSLSQQSLTQQLQQLQPQPQQPLTQQSLAQQLQQLQLQPQQPLTQQSQQLQQLQQQLQSLQQTAPQSIYYTS